MQQKQSIYSYPYSSTSRQLPPQLPLTCKFHPSNPLHTFCLDPSCLLPMCTACISIHNNDHMQAKTHGQYKEYILNLYSLSGLIISCLQELGEKMLILEQLSIDYVDDYADKVGVAGRWRIGLEKVRARMHDQVDRVFQRFCLDMDEKMGNYSQELHAVYEKLEQRVQQLYKQLQKQKQDLNKYYNSSFPSFPQSTSSLSLRSPRTKRSSYTPDQTFPILDPTSPSPSQNTNTNTKQQRKVIKTLIEYYSKNKEEINEIKINKIKQEIQSLKCIKFDIRIYWDVLSQVLKNLCYEVVEVEVVMVGEKDGGKDGNNKFFSSDVSNNSAYNNMNSNINYINSYNTSNNPKNHNNSNYTNSISNSPNPNTNSNYNYKIAPQSNYNTRKKQQIVISPPESKTELQIPNNSAYELHEIMRNTEERMKNIQKNKDKDKDKDKDKGRWNQSDVAVGTGVDKLSSIHDKRDKQKQTAGGYGQYLNTNAHYNDYTNYGNVERI